MKIQGRTFVISGGASGLGLACAQSLYHRGGNIAILDVNEGQAAEALQELSNSSSPQDKAQDDIKTRIRFWRCDVRNSQQIRECAREVEAWTTETKKPLGGIIPAAGIGQPSLTIDRHGKAIDMAAFDLVIDINLRAVIDLTSQFLELMVKVDPKLLAAAEEEEEEEAKDGERGVVLLVSSAAAFDGQRGQLAYAASKGAIASLTLTMARDLSRWGIRVVTIAPSLFATPMMERASPRVRQNLASSLEFPRRMGRPAEFAQLAVQCVENSMLNGTVIRLDGATRMSSKL